MKNKKASSIFKIGMVIVLFLGSAALFAQQVGGYAADRLIVKFKSDIPYISEKNNKLTGISVLDLLNSKYGCSSIEQMYPSQISENKAGADLKMNNTAIIKFSGYPDIQQAVKEYMSSGLFEYVEPDFQGELAGKLGVETVPNDTYYSKQYGLKNNGTFPDAPSKAGADINIEPAWNITTGSTSVVVGIIDSGNKLGHPEFSGRIWSNTGEIPGNGIDDDGNGYKDDTKGGWDFSNKDNDPTDDHGHGTNVAGIIGANGNNSSLYAGVDWKCKLMIVKGLVANGTGYYSDWALGIHYCVDNGARIINMSLEGTSSSQTLEDAVTYAYQNNVLCVVCMGNYNSSAPSYPAACTHAFGVGATNAMDNRCNPFFWGGGSDFGPNIKVMAPGDRIYGLDYASNTNQNTYWGGTSQAAPHAAGLAALLLAQNPARTVDQLMTIIEVTADDQVGLASEDTKGFDQYYGYGRINAYKALTYSATGVNNLQLSAALRAFPNPFTNELSVAYSLSQPSSVKIEIYDVFGRSVLVVNKGNLPAGDHLERVNSIHELNVPSGFYTLSVVINDSERINLKLIKAE